MASPVFTFPGTLQGRIQPIAVQATDGSWLMVLGTDQDPLPSFHLDIGDTLTVSQPFDATSHELLRFDWRMRFAPNLPKFKAILAAGAANIIAPVETPVPPSGVTLIPATQPTVDIEFAVPAAYNGGTVTMVYLPTGVRRTAIAASSVVRAGDLMAQTDPPTTTLSDYEMRLNDAGLIRLVGSGRDRLTGLSIDGAAPFEKAHAEQLLDVSGAPTGGNNGTNFRVTAVPEAQGGVASFDLQVAGAIPAGRVVILENAAAVKEAAPSATISVRGAQWRAQAFVDIGGGDILRAEVIENLVQADPDGWQRGSMAMHVSKAGLLTVTFKLSLESTTS